MADGQKPQGAGRQVGVGVAVVAICFLLGINGSVWDLIRPSSSGGGSETSQSSARDPEVQTSDPPVSQAEVADPPVAAAPVQAPPAPTMSSIRVESGEASEAVPCCKVGPNTFQIQDSRSASFGYHWAAVMSDGTTNDTDTCSILVTVSGPEAVESLRTDKCTTKRSNSFSGFKNYANVATPGTYTVTVVDQLSGASGSIEIAVVP